MHSASKNNFTGIASLVAGIFVFSVQDTIIKQVSGDHAVTLAIFLRSIVSFPILIVMVHYESGLRSVITPMAPMLILRGLMMLTAYLAYYIAFPALPLAEAIALFFIAPLFITIGSGPFLGERVSSFAWISVVLGLIGVFVILRPGSALFEPAALLSLFSAATYAFGMLLSRKHGKAVSASVQSFYQNMTYIVGSLVIAAMFAMFVSGEQSHPSLAFLTRAWAWPNTWDLTLMLACGVIAALAVVLLTHGYRMGEASIVTPFEYTGMVWASFWGYMIFEEVPKLTTFVGMTLIAAAGVLAMRAGRRVMPPD
jgi:drug/metabolite transporter (DMT)-like permease